jgi:aminobenzoyl-glutamate transport protein
MTDATELTGAARRQRGFLGFVEKVGNFLPDPIMIFVWLIAILMLVSAIGAAQGWSASLSYPGEEAPEYGVLENGVLTYTATSLFAEDNIRRLFVEMPRTLTTFAPLGLVLLVMFGAGVAERVGLFSALIRASLREAPRVILTPLVCIIGMTSHHASDAAYVVFIPLAALLYAAVGRHPLVGLAAAFAAVSGGYAGNITPGQIDVLLFGFTEEAAQIIDPTWTMNPLGNWYFIPPSSFSSRRSSGSSPTASSSRVSASGAARRMRASRPNSRSRRSQAKKSAGCFGPALWRC